MVRKQEKTEAKAPYYMPKMMMMEKTEDGRTCDRQFLAS